MRTFTPRKERKKKGYFRQFVRWITTGATVKDLTSQGSFKASERSLLRYFYQFLDKPPLPKRLVKPKKVYLKIDGTYFRRWGCALVYKEGKEIIFWNFVERENYQHYCLDLAQIKSLGYQVKGVTSDRHGSLISVVRNLLPGIPHQHCLVHLQRFCQSLLTQKPQLQAGKELLELVRLLNTITTPYQKNIWLKWLERLSLRYESLIKERTYGENEETGKKTWWYTHKNLRRAFKTLQNSKDNLFLYLNYPHLPKDINGLEAEFSHLKRKLSLHRGLKRERKANFVKWYFFLKSTNQNP